VKKTLNAVAQTIFDKKGFNIIALDVKGLSSLTDYLVIAEGNIDRHVKAIGSSVVQALKEMKNPAWHVEGDKVGDWLVIDAGDVIIHLMTPELREKYGIEFLWKDAKIVDLDIVTEKK
jgi:ribosome-associated protein